MDSLNSLSQATSFNLQLSRCMTGGDIDEEDEAALQHSIRDIVVSEALGRQTSCSDRPRGENISLLLDELNLVHGSGN